MSEHAQKNGHAPPSRDEAEAALTAAPLTLGLGRGRHAYALYDDGDRFPGWLGFTADVERMLAHPDVALPFSYFKAGVSTCNFKIKARSEEEAKFARETLEKMWSEALEVLQLSYDYGWCAYEVCYRRKAGLLRWDALIEQYPLDSWALVKHGGYAGCRIKGAYASQLGGYSSPAPAAGDVELWGPCAWPAKGLWLVHNRRWDRFHGLSQLYGAWRPYRRLAARDGAEEVIDGGVYRFAYKGPEVRYPPDNFRRRDGSTDYDAARQEARQIAEQAKAGYSIALPNTTDPKSGKYVWEVLWPERTLNVDSLLSYEGNLQAQISRGVGVPPELLEASETGSGWSGRKVPLLGFYQGQVRIARSIVRALVRQIIQPLLIWNWGKGAFCEVEVSLDLPKALGGGQQGEEGQPPPPPPGQPPPAPEPGPAEAQAEAGPLDQLLPEGAAPLQLSLAGEGDAVELRYDVEEYPPWDMASWCETAAWELAAPDPGRYIQKVVSRGPRRGQTHYYDTRGRKFMPDGWQPGQPKKAGGLPPAAKASAPTAAKAAAAPDKKGAAGVGLPPGLARIRDAAKKDLADQAHPANRLRGRLAEATFRNGRVRTIRGGDLSASDHEAMDRLHSRAAAALGMAGRKEEAEAQLGAAKFHRVSAEQKKAAAPTGPAAAPPAPAASTAAPAPAAPPPADDGPEDFRLPEGYEPPEGDRYNVPNKALPRQSRPALDRDEAEAATYYSGGGYSYLNDALWSGETPPATAGKGTSPATAHAKLQEAFARATPFAKPAFVRRGLDFGSPGDLADYIDRFRQAGPGGRVRLAGYQSTTTNDDDTTSDFGGSVRMSIMATHGLDLKPYSGYANEGELLLNHDSEFEVHSLEEKGGTWHVRLRQLPPAGQAARELSLGGEGRVTPRAAPAGGDNHAKKRIYGESPPPSSIAVVSRGPDGWSPSEEHGRFWGESAGDEPPGGALSLAAAFGALGDVPEAAREAAWLSLAGTGWEVSDDSGGWEARPEPAGAIELAGDDSAWQPYQGPKGGKGWKNTQTGKVAYQKNKPGAGGPKPGDKPATEQSAAKMQAAEQAVADAVKKGAASPEDVEALAGALSKLTVKELAALKKKLTIKATAGKKAELAKKIAEKALAGLPGVAPAAPAEEDDSIELPEPEAKASAEGEGGSVELPVDAGELAGKISSAYAGADPTALQEAAFKKAVDGLDEAGLAQLKKELQLDDSVGGKELIDRYAQAMAAIFSVGAADTGNFSDGAAGAAYQGLQAWDKATLQKVAQTMGVQGDLANMGPKTLVLGIVGAAQEQAKKAKAKGAGPTAHKGPPSTMEEWEEAVKAVPGAVPGPKPPAPAPEAPAPALEAPAPAKPLGDAAAAAKLTGGAKTVHGVLAGWAAKGIVPAPGAKAALQGHIDELDEQALKDLYAAAGMTYHGVSASAVAYNKEKLLDRFFAAQGALAKLKAAHTGGPISQEELDQLDSVLGAFSYNKLVQIAQDEFGLKPGDDFAPGAPKLDLREAIIKAAKKGAKLKGIDGDDVVLTPPGKSGGEALVDFPPKEEAKPAPAALDEKTFSAGLKADLSKKSNAHKATADLAKKLQGLDSVLAMKAHQAEIDALSAPKLKALYEQLGLEWPKWGSVNGKKKSLAAYLTGAQTGLAKLKEMLAEKTTGGAYHVKQAMDKLSLAKLQELAVAAEVPAGDLGGLADWEIKNKIAAKVAAPPAGVAGASYSTPAPSAPSAPSGAPKAPAGWAPQPGHTPEQMAGDLAPAIGSPTKWLSYGKDMAKSMEEALTPHVGAEAAAKLAKQAEAKKGMMFLPDGFKPPVPYSNKPSKALAGASRPELSLGEAKAFVAYTGSSYSGMNTPLWTGGEPDGEHGKYHKDLQKAFAKAQPLDKPVLLGRGLKFLASELEAYMKQYHDAGGVGGIVELKGYQSASTSEGYSGNVKLKILARHGLDALPYSLHPGEDEMLLNHNAKYRIRAMDKVGSDWHIKLEQFIPDDMAGPKPQAPAPEQPKPPPAAPAPQAPKTLAKAKTVETLPASPAGLAMVKGLGGSTGAKLVQGPDGSQYVHKKGSSPGHLREEAHADAAYRALGIGVPAGKVYETAEGPVKLAHFEEGEDLDKYLAKATPEQKGAVMKEIQKGFVADALLGNWDVAGLSMDNVKVKPDGSVLRIDNGGALRYRAQGSPKGGKFGAEVNELQTLRDAALNPSSAKVFSGITDAEIKAQVGTIVGKRQQLLAALPPDLHGVMNQRLDWLASKYGA